MKAPLFIKKIPALAIKTLPNIIRIIISENPLETGAPEFITICARTAAANPLGSIISKRCLFCCNISSFSDIIDTDVVGDALSVATIVYHGPDGSLGGGDDTAGTVDGITPLVSTYGSLTIDSAGNYVYDLNDDPAQACFLQMCHYISE